MMTALQNRQGLSGEKFCHSRGQTATSRLISNKISPGVRSIALPSTEIKGRCSSRMSAASSTSPAVNENFKGDVLDPSIFNKNWVRIAGIGLAIAGSARGTEFLSTRAAAFVHLTSFSLNFGMISWVTFVAGLVMFKNMGRQQFGKLQSKLFPKYFLISVVTLALQIGTLKYALPGGLRSEQARSLGIALGGSIINFVVEPLGTKVLFERYALENASGPKDKEKIKSLKGKFGAFHGISSLLNLIVLIAVAAHGYYLASQISFT